MTGDAPSYRRRYDVVLMLCACWDAICFNFLKDKNANNFLCFKIYDRNKLRAHVNWECKTLNPFMPNGISLPDQLGESISNLKAVGW